MGAHVAALLQQQVLKLQRKQRSNYRKSAFNY
jgi:hypothetical protein